MTLQFDSAQNAKSSYDTKITSLNKDIKQQADHKLEKLEKLDRLRSIEATTTSHSKDAKPRKPSFQLRGSCQLAGMETHSETSTCVNWSQLESSNIYPYRGMGYPKPTALQLGTNSGKSLKLCDVWMGRGSLFAGRR
jgi:hypothetical protein